MILLMVGNGNGSRVIHLSNTLTGELDSQVILENTVSCFGIMASGTILFVIAPYGTFVKYIIPDGCHYEKVTLRVHIMNVL